jgi:2'-5' RNA ligase
MTVASHDEILTYWLIPNEPARTYFAALIRELATRFEAPAFEPHVTVYSTTVGNEDPADVLKRVVTKCAPYRLVVSGIDYSEEFTKTLFVQFHRNEALAKLNADLRSASASSDDYELNPHLSLIYKKMRRETKEEIAHSLTLPFSEVVFDSAKALIVPAKIESRADVEAWRVVAAAQPLTG